MRGRGQRQGRQLGRGGGWGGAAAREMSLSQLEVGENQCIERLASERQQLGHLFQASKVATAAWRGLVRDTGWPRCWAGPTVDQARAPAPPDAAKGFEG